MTTKTWKPIETQEQFSEYTRELHNMEATFTMTEKLIVSTYFSGDLPDYNACIEQCFKCSEAYTKWLAAKTAEMGYGDLKRACREWREKNAATSPYANLVKSIFGEPQAGAEATTPPAAG